MSGGFKGMSRGIFGGGFSGNLPAGEAESGTGIFSGKIRLGINPLLADTEINLAAFNLTFKGNRTMRIAPDTGGSQDIGLLFIDSTTASIGRISQNTGSGDMIIETHPGAGTTEVKLNYSSRSVSISKLGINVITASPAIFTVNSSATNDLPVLITATGLGGIGLQMQWRNITFPNDNNSSIIFSAAGGIFTGTNRSFTIQTGDGGGAGNVLLPLGNLGIHVAVPLEALHIDTTAGQGQIRMSNGANFWTMGRDQDNNGEFIIRNNAGTKFLIDNVTGAITIASLAGTGSRTVVASATGVLSAP